MPHFILIPVFFIIALIYSTAGLGGGSAYITAMVIAGIPRETLTITALGCNLLVAGQGFLRFKSAGYFRREIFWPFAVTSIPCAYIGGRIQISDKAFIIIMSAALTLAAVRLIFFERTSTQLLSARESRSYDVNSRLRPDIYRGFARIIYKCLIGIVLGLLAGITGIGGGIYLIPALLLLGIANAKEAASVASLFIFVNSLSGIAGQLTRGKFDPMLFIPLAVAVIIGGYIGSKAGAAMLKPETLQKIVGFIMLLAVIKLLSKLL